MTRTQMIAEANSLVAEMGSPADCPGDSCYAALNDGQLAVIVGELRAMRDGEPLDPWDGEDLQDLQFL